MASLKLTKLTSLSPPELSDLLIYNSPCADTKPVDVIIEGAKLYSEAFFRQPILAKLSSNAPEITPFEESEIYASIMRVEEYALYAKYCTDNTDYEIKEDGFRFPPWHLFEDVHSIYSYFNTVKKMTSDPSLSQRYFLLFAQSAYIRFRLDFSFLNDSTTDEEDGNPRFTKGDIVIMSEHTIKTVDTYHKKFDPIIFDIKKGYRPNNLYDHEPIEEIEAEMIGQRYRTSSAAILQSESIKWLNNNSNFQETNFYTLM